MRFHQFLQHLQKDNPCSVYLLKGDSDLLLDEAWKALESKIVPPDAKGFNGERLRAGDVEADEVVSRMRTLPMFGSRQLLMVLSVENWKKEQRQTLDGYLARPNPNSCLVMSAKSMKGLEKLEASVAACGMVVELPALTERELPRWIQERARSLGKQISPQAAAHLVELTGEDLHRLDGELEKVCLYTGERSRIELDDVEEAVSTQRSFTVFELLGYVARNQPREAVASLKSLLLSGEAPLPVLSLLVRHIRMIWQVKDCMRRGLSLPQICKEVGLPPNAVKNYTQQAPAFSEDDLAAAHAFIREADSSFKSTGMNPELILESVILELCMKKQKPL